jgi:hypothetical protein
MNPFENQQPLIDRNIERENAHEQIFVATINERLIEEFEEDLYDLTENDELVGKILDSINAYGAEDQKKILSIPKSIRKLRFSALLEKTSRGGSIDAGAFVKELFDDAKAKGYTLGYHMSQFKIPEESSGWDIDPTGLDDRDDRPMAYYSLDYKNLFRKNRGQYIYVVRAETGTDSTHKRDTSNNWGRANKLSVITSLSSKEVDEKIEKLEKEKIKEAA